MRMKLNTKIIKDSLIEELIRDKRIMSLLDYQDDHLKAHDIMNNKIFTYFKTYSGSAKSFICIDVDEYESDYRVRIKIECHEDLSKSKESRFYNKADEIAVYVKECINNVFPKATGYHNVSHYGSVFLIRDISFRVNAEDECVIPNEKKLNKKIIYKRGKMISEEKAKDLIRNLVYKTCDNLGYGKKVNGFGCISYEVNGKTMILSEYQDYCFKKEIKKFGIN